MRAPAPTLSIFRSTRSVSKAAEFAGLLEGSYARLIPAETPPRLATLTALLSEQGPSGDEGRMLRLDAGPTAALPLSDAPCIG